MLGLVVERFIDKQIMNIMNIENLENWLESIPEVARSKESANVLAPVYFVEMLKGEERKEVSVNT